jgi:hypothetical protein
MPTKKYALEVGGPTRLTVSWGFRWKNFVVRLDDREIGRIDGGFDAVRAGSTFDLPDGSKLRVQVVMKGIAPEVDLFVDDKPVPGSGAVPLPKWAYAFIAVCVVIPMITMGGAVPAAIGIGAAAGCASVARDESKTMGTRVAYCAGITALAWGLFVAFVVAFGVFGSR